MSTTSPSRTNEVVDLLRIAILDGTFLPGTALREVALAERYVVSRRTVREALLALNEQGLVVHRHHTGAVVRTLDADDIRDLYRVRRLLECEGVRHALTCEPDLRTAVGTALERLETAVRRGGINTVELAEADAAFHGAIIALSGSRRLDDFYAHIGTQMTHAITVIQRHDESNDIPPESTIAEHREIAEALHSGDLLLAQRLILHHIDRYESLLLSAVPRDAGPWDHLAPGSRSISAG
ncbi:GntR family transcriptional regulator [Nocardioides sp. NPDC006303]|uniref:GntR family transcriptional regulator n=1 Tax=Nocardioides sp. NPDC006303 TaxID=3156747 RepID=UPI0033B70EEE